LAALSALYPLIEFLDRWDAPGPSSDSEIQLIAVLTLVGLVFVLAHLLASLGGVVRASISQQLSAASDSRTHRGVCATYPEMTASPPLPLRI
jgi:hypothetical protein